MRPQPGSLNGGLSATRAARAPGNLSRGFFRLWLVLSICWIAGTSWFLRDQLHFSGPWEVPWRLIAPQFVVLSHDELKKLSYDQLEKYNARRNEATARGLYCPNSTLSGRPVSELTRDEALCELAVYDAIVWQERLNAAAIVLGPPLGLLIFGYLVGWIMRGFAAESSSQARQ